VAAGRGKTGPARGRKVAAEQWGTQAAGAPTPASAVADDPSLLSRELLSPGAAVLRARRDSDPTPPSY